MSTPMPPQDWLKEHTDVSDRAAAGAGWQEGWRAGQAADRAQTVEPPLTDDEHRAIELAGELWNLLNRIVRPGRSRAEDRQAFWAWELLDLTPSAAPIHTP